MLASTTKRRFTDEFKREAVALWETSGRLQTEVAAELGIMLTMLRRWQRKLQESSVPPASLAAKAPGSTMASPADQASEIARLRRELDRTRMKRDISIEGPPASLQRCRGEVRFRRAACVHLAGERHVPHARRVWQRSLCLARLCAEHANDSEPDAAG
jgi:transposase